MCPVIRIGVNELHIDSPEFFQEITKVGSKFVKETNFYRGISFPTSSIGLIDPAAHRIRRQVLNPIFTSTRVAELAPGIQTKVQHLCSKFDELVATKTPINLYAAFKSFTMDVVSEMVFGYEFGVMNSPGFRHPHLDALHDAIEKGWVLRAFPNLGWLSMNLPDWLSSAVFPIPIVEFGKICRTRIDTYLTERKRSDNKVSSIVLEQLLDSNAARGHVIPNALQLNEEALTLLTAGNDTTANAVILGTYYICTHPKVYAQLNDELRKAFPNLKEDVTYEKSRQLPYLTAVIKEFLRCSNPLPGRLPRVVPSEGISFNGAIIPPGTIVHTSSYLLNRHETVWGKTANQFDPDRWLEKGSASLEKYMTSFYKGSRQCLGLNLAWCELYLLIGTIFRRYEIEIYKTTAADMAWSDHLLIL
ncbi:hypothetical protein MMC17_000307 [Xylographa soralifera]|nr:hypothetical protein [Xylographa soralifera]